MLLAVNSYDTVRDVKVKIHQQAGIPPEQQCLVHPRPGLHIAAKTMRDDRTIWSYFSTGSCAIELVTCGTIFVNRSKEERLQLAGRIAVTTTREIKATIQKTLNIPASWQPLMFAGKVLEDSWRHSLRDLEVQEGSTLDLVVSSTPSDQEVSVGSVESK